MGKIIFNLLPDFSGVLLAAVGIALVVEPEFVSKWPERVRFFLSVLLILVGGVGLWSSFIQKRDEAVEKIHFQSEDRDKNIEMQKKLEEVTKIIAEYGPKLDAIIAHPESPDQLTLAKELRKNLKPLIKLDEPKVTTAVPSILLNSIETNIGGSIAKNVKNTVILKIAPIGKISEDQLFEYLRAHENDRDQPTSDIPPGFDSRQTIPITADPPIPTGAVLQMRISDALYIGLLVTYYDEQGRQYHTEKCMYAHGAGNELNHFCDAHNLTY